MSWATPETVRQAVESRWVSGALLRGHATGEVFTPIRVSLKGPNASEVADRLAEIEDWIARLKGGSRDGGRYELLWKEVGGRRFQRERLPSHAVVTSYAQAWALLGKLDEVRRFDALLAAADDVPAARDWALAHPQPALKLFADWSTVLAAYAWLDGHRGSGRYLREVSAPGVDTKFAEQHRGVLGALLGVRGSPGGFLDDLGLSRKPELVRLRPAPEMGLPTVSELAVRAEELAGLDLAPRSALIIENEITYLSVPVPEGGLVLWGKGFDVDKVGRLPWLAGVDVTYWGDVDTHGFVILNRLREWLPEVRSVLMDRETLLAHRARWVQEQHPTDAPLNRLDTPERQLYRDLVEDRLGVRVRLEQELIDWPWVVRRLP